MSVANLIPGAGNRPGSRKLVLWSSASVLCAVVAVLLNWFIVAPLVHTHKVVRRCADNDVIALVAVDDLGGQLRAARYLGIYLRLPRAWAKNRPVAARILGHCGKAALPALVEAARDDDSRVRRAVAKSFGLMGADTSSCVPTLKELLTDSSRAVRVEAALSLWWVAQEATESARVLGECLGNSEVEVRLDAAKALAEIGPHAREAAPALIQMLRDTSKLSEDPRPRQWAVSALGRMRAKEATQILAEIVENLEPSVTLDAIHALGDIGPDAKAAMPSLEELIKLKIRGSSIDPVLRDAAVEALARIRGEVLRGSSEIEQE